MNLAKQAESDGWQDFNAETFGTDENYEEKGAHWETFEDGKYLPDYDLGWQNAQIEHELTLEKKQLEENNKMSITKEQLRSLIREQMSNVSEVADDDVPVTSLSDGFDAAREAVEAMYSPTDRRYISAMMVIDMAEKQDQQKAKDEEPMSAEDRLSYMWDFDKRSHPDPSGVETTNPFKITKENLERIIKEELAIALEGLGPAAKTARKAAQAAKIDVSEYPRKQGRDDGADGKERRYPEGEAVEYDEGYEEGMEIKLALDTAFGRLEETSVNEQ
jgi:hypothetical protein